MTLYVHSSHCALCGGGKVAIIVATATGLDFIKFVKQQLMNRSHRRGANSRNWTKAKGFANWQADLFSGCPYSCRCSGVV